MEPITLVRRPAPEPPKPPSLESTLELLASAEAAVSQSAAMAESKTHEAERLALQLAEAQALAAEDALANPEAIGQITQQLRQLQAEQDLAHQAAELAMVKVDDARRGVVAAKVEAIRARGRRLREVAEIRRARTAELLAGVQAFEGCLYAPAVTWTGGGEHRAVSISQKIENRAGWLDREARDLEQKLQRAESAQQLAKLASKGMPEETDAERIALASVAAEAPDALDG
ncbi:hypothetical protein RB614_40475 [Phytohabitans sp. ZYX-F-186]|uniref:PspA/IM30 family protein n=1 Tax=Phytohabitans maris TaxID=3071409 RepID=A0ABU0ZUR4_9ACTN|nr:hypothetical protein [Phytohabitans sp. ZYX-F-186]MDQ7910786.1 hypothetical protein [Phytohabitans sp. ZYX-F-186]